MRKHPRVNTCPFGWRIPAVVLLNNPTSTTSTTPPPQPPPVSYFPVHCGMTNKQVQAEEESNVQPPQQGSVAECFSKPAEAPELSHSDCESAHTLKKRQHVILNTSVCPGNVSHNMSIYTRNDNVTLIDPFLGNLVAGGTQRTKTRKWTKKGR